MPTIVDKSGNIDYFGRLSWGNFFDWLVTFCLGAIIAILTVSLGGVRADTHVLVLPLFSVLLVLHGIWIALDDERPKRLSYIPVAFLPFFAWVAVSAHWLSPTGWLGRYELIYGLEAFIFFWVAVNNVRTRAHLWMLIVIALSPGGYAMFIGFYQFFQNPTKMASALADHGIRLSPEFLGQATGSFADPNSYAVFLLLVLPLFLIAGGVPRLPVVLRVLCLYIASMFIAGLVFAQVFWPLLLVVPILFLIPSLCYKSWARRLLFPVVGSVLIFLVFAGVAFFFPPFKDKFETAISPEGEGVRLVLWEEAGRIFLDQPLTGAGAGSFPVAFEQSLRVSLAGLPETPHNDYLLLLSEYGLIGVLLFGAPICYVLVVAIKRWKAEPLRVKLKGKKETVMPPQKFFLSLGLAGISSYLLCSFFSFVFYVPALVLHGILFFAILVKSSLNRRLKIPSLGIARFGYVAAGIGLGLLFYYQAAPLLQAQATELEARQRLDLIVGKRVHVSGNSALLDGVIEKYEMAAELDPTNADVWIGLSAANCQRFFRNPASFREIGRLATEQAQRAVDVSAERYWRAWAQLGVAYSLSGDVDEAEVAFSRALDLAPNSSNAHYFQAAFLSNFPGRSEEALHFVERALEINPNNPAARRLQQKLLIL